MATTTREAPPEPRSPDPDRFELLARVDRRVLWLSTLMVHHANKVRPNPTGIKVGGHQASSASTVGILTSLFFDVMRPGDRVSVKPHASPVLHAIQYLLGHLDADRLRELRQLHGLQAYPSRTKDPDPVDFSTGSVGLGSVAPNFAALVDEIVRSRTGAAGPRPRYIAVVGDAELDEGSVWEAIAEPALAGLENLLWVIDLNRQSLDRVVPGIRVRQLQDMFRANGWAVFEAKYGSRLEAAFRRPGGADLRRRIDAMPNEEYQLLLRSPAAAVREALGARWLDELADADLIDLLGDLGGHDHSVLHSVFAQAVAAQAPAVVFAYTIKGWGLPIAADPLNHSALLTSEQVTELRDRLGIGPSEEWERFPDGSPEAALCAERAVIASRKTRPRPLESAIPIDLERVYQGRVSTQRVFGQVLTELARVAPAVAERVVTVSPDVATSTNLGGWINKVGVWEGRAQTDAFGALGPRLIQWERGPRGQHVELGISETNLLMLLGQLGLAGDSTGETLLPIGTLYDPFVARALDAFIYSLYSGSRFILVGTPSGVTLAPEGGAHQSVITPSVGLALPEVVYWEPCFAQELEWVLLAALRLLVDSERPQSSYLRLSTAPVDQGLLPVVDRESLRLQVLDGAYRLLDRRQAPGARAGHNTVDIWATGVMVVEALKASDELLRDGVYASVVNCVSPDLVYRRWQEGMRQATGSLRLPPPPAGSAPVVVTVLDGHPSALAWIGSMLGARVIPLGVTRFGESGTAPELYATMGIDADRIAAACFAALS